MPRPAKQALVESEVRRGRLLPRLESDKPSVTLELHMPSAPVSAPEGREGLGMMLRNGARSHSKATYRVSNIRTLPSLGRTPAAVQGFRDSFMIVAELDSMQLIKKQ